MRRSDVAETLRPSLVRCEQHPNCHALVAPPTPRQLPSDPAISQHLAAAMQALERIRTAVQLLPNADLVTHTLARREAVQSSQIEGTQTKLSELLEYEATSSGDGLPADAAVTSRYVHALEHGLRVLRNQGRPALTSGLVRDMHRILMQDGPVHVRAGHYRDVQAWIGSGRIEDATFIPAPPAYLDACMQEFEQSTLQYAAREAEPWTLTAVPQVAIAHAQFETIHPFADGNGRVGRLLIPLVFAAEGYPPLYVSGHLLRHRRAYYGALADVQLRGDWRPWLSLLGAAVVHACDGAVAIARDLNAICDDWALRLAGIRADATAHKLPKYLLGRPVVSVNQVAAAFGISFVAANRAIEQLVARGILSEPRGRRNRVFHARDILQRLERD